MSDVVESELIGRYNPKYNTAKKSEWCGFPFIEPEWKKYKPWKKEISNKKVSDDSKKQKYLEKRKNWIKMHRPTIEDNLKHNKSVLDLINSFEDDLKSENYFIDDNHYCFKMSFDEWENHRAFVEWHTFDSYGGYTLCGGLARPKPDVSYEGNKSPSPLTHDFYYRISCDTFHEKIKECKQIIQEFEEFYDKYVVKGIFD